MVLVNVVQNLVVQRDQILQFRLGQAALGSCYIRQSVEHQYASMLLFDPFEQHHDGVHDRVGQIRVLGLRVASPAADFREDQFHEDGQAALLDGVRDEAPLVVGQVSARFGHPHPKKGLVIKQHWFFLQLTL